MQPHRFTISLAQLMLLAMLTTLLCVWLPAAVRLNRRSFVEVPERLDCLLSQDASVLFSRSGECGFAAFETKSGRCLHSESKSEWMAAGFDPCSKQIAVFSDLLEDRYALRAINLETGRTTYTSPSRLRSGMVQQLIAPDLGSDYTPLLRGDRVYEIPVGDGTDPLVPYLESYLRCWSISDGKEIFCLPLGKTARYWPNLYSGRFYYVAPERSTTAGEISVTKALLARDLESGQVLGKFDFFESIFQADGFAPCHRSNNFAFCTTNREVRDGEIIRDDSGIYMAKGQGEPQRIVAIPGLQIIAFEANDETIWHLGIRDNGLQVLVRRNIERGDDIRTYDVGHENTALVTDFKLLPGEKEVALAADDGSFRVLDVESGKELRRLTGLKYVPSYRQLYILTGVAGAWLILWWLATRPKPSTPPQLARLLGYAVFLAGLVQGLLFLGIRDQVDHVHGPTLFAAVGIPSLLAITGAALLFDARCHKGTIIYGILACAGMIAYALWIRG
jgi:hypothetical protein